MKDVPVNMRVTGMLLLHEAFLEAAQRRNLRCVVHTAQAAEILLKARIAEEHPLLIFSKFPKQENTDDLLTLLDLLEKGRTLTYEELPDRLWATTGIKLEKEKLAKYREFGRIRNQIVHLSMTSTQEPDVLTLSYVVEVLDPLVESFWGKSVIDFIAHNPNYQDWIREGTLEHFLSQKIEIDERLRRLIGEESQKALAHLEYMTQKDKELWSDLWSDPEYVQRQVAYYEAHKEEIHANDEAIAAEQKVAEKWQDFLKAYREG
ncbi:hypothetical protein Lepto7375DRAFT_6806 [Leptolyngbya sp. PCC 7375]|nr:hypothetical protein Lepto7375DRAFT_6806 [Leptolyngbya sp. PCC 7375]